MKSRKEYQKEYYIKNKERIYKEGKEITKCELCNIELQKWSLYGHNNSVRHRCKFYLNI